MNIKQNIIATAAILLMASTTNAQGLLGKLKDKAIKAGQKKVEQVVTKKAEKAVEGAVMQTADEQTATTDSPARISPTDQSKIQNYIEPKKKLTQYKCDVFNGYETKVATEYVDGMDFVLKEEDGKHCIQKDSVLYVIDHKSKTITKLDLRKTFKGGKGFGDRLVTQMKGSPVSSNTKVVYLEDESIDGVLCRHYVAYVSSSDGSMNSDREVWEHPEWGIPLKVVTAASKEFTEIYRNFEIGPQPKELFELPRNYRMIDGWAMFQGMGK